MIKMITQHNAIMNWSHVFRMRTVDLAREMGKQKKGFNLGIGYPPALEQNAADSILVDIAKKGVWATGAALTAEPGDVLLFFDIQDIDPGPLLSLDKVWKIGMVRGGPHEPWDFTRGRGGRYEELFAAQLKCYDELWVTTHYHAALLMESYKIPVDKIKIVGSPMDIPLAAGESSLIATEEGERLNLLVPWEAKSGILFCSRQDNDKGYDLALHLKETTDLPIRIERFDNRRDLYGAIAESKYVLIPTRKETFGQLAAETLLLGSMPLVPYGFNYPEILTMNWPFYLSGGVKYGEELTLSGIEGLVRQVVESDIDDEEIQQHLARAAVGYMEYDERFDAAMFDLFRRDNFFKEIS
jgi:hypothetical protein